jgi:hypothetical protein
MEFAALGKDPGDPFIQSEAQRLGEYAWHGGQRRRKQLRLLRSPTATIVTIVTGSFAVTP